MAVTPWGSIIGGALGLGGSIYGTIQASNAAKKVKQNIENQQRENQNWYDRRYNEDPTQRADAQRLLTLTAERIKERNKAAAGAAAVAGGTEESVAATKEANAKALADTASQIAAQGDARKDAIEAQYMAKKDALNAQQNQAEMQKAQAIAQATGALGSAAMNAGTGVDEYLLDANGNAILPQQKKLNII